MATYSQNLVVIDPVTMGDQRTVGNRIFSEDERWLYRIEPGSDAPTLVSTGSMPRITAPLAPIRSSRPAAAESYNPRAAQAAPAQKAEPRHRWPQPYEVAAGACASAVATGVVGGLGIGGTMIRAAVTSLRMVTVALVVSVFTVVVGVLWLAPSVGQEAGSWVHRATGSLEQWRESAQRAWPYLKGAWRAFR